MEYVKGTPFFCQHEKIKKYPYLNRDISTDVLIVGGGIVGAIANFYISQKYDTTLVDKSRFGRGCTSCATVLLEYQLDDYASELLKFMNEEQVVDVYRMGLESIEKIDKFVREHGNFCHFAKRPSLLYTNNIFGVKAIEEEFDFRVKHGFKAKLIDEENNPFPFKIKRGLFCEDGGAEFNPYLFTKQMLESAQNQKKLFENTEIDKIERTKTGFVATTNFGEKIFCNKIVLSTGYNFELVKQSLCERDVSYCIVTKPVKSLSIPQNTLVQDDKEPYHYLRILPYGRLIFGGEDAPSKGKPINEKVAYKKYKKLHRDLCKLFPQEEIEVDFQFCGYFGWTDNNLGLIGESVTPNIYHMISCGANGVINAMFGAQLLLDLFAHTSNPLTPLFSPLRKK